MIKVLSGYLSSHRDQYVMDVVVVETAILRATWFISSGLAGISWRLINYGFIIIIIIIDVDSVVSLCRNMFSHWPRWSV